MSVSPAKTQSFSIIDSSLNTLDYSNVSLQVDSNNKNQLYFESNSGDDYKIVNLREPGFDYDCADNNFINLETTTVIENNSEIYRKKTNLVSYVFLLNDSFSITADTSSNPNILNDFSYSEINSLAVVKIGRDDATCDYTSEINKSTEKSRLEFEKCDISIRIKSLDGESFEVFTSTFGSKVFEKFSLQDINNYTYFIDSDLNDSADQHIGYFRFYLNGKFEILDLNKDPI
tara:strand:- start:66 stop:758 length:693 start_codon:yes stop_codon:yes gene_type:complete